MVLTEQVLEDSLVRSCGEFAYHAIGTGPTTWGTDEVGRIASYFRVVDVQGRWLFTFPMQLALQFDKEKASELSVKSSPNEYEIDEGTERDSIPTIYYDQVENFNNLFEGTIVLIGYLGPEDEGLYSVKFRNGKERKEYMSWIIARSVVDILMDLEDKRL